MGPLGFSDDGLLIGVERPPALAACQGLYELAQLRIRLFVIQNASQDSVLSGAHCCCFAEGGMKVCASHLCSMPTTCFRLATRCSMMCIDSCSTPHVHAVQGTLVKTNDTDEVQGIVISPQQATDAS